MPTIDEVISDRLRKLSGIFSRVKPVPTEWLGTPKVNGNGKYHEEDACLPCEAHKDLITAWKKGFKWTAGLDHGLACMLSSILSTEFLGDQLWFRVMGPASCGKSSLAEAVARSKRFVIAKSTISGFHSGWREAGGKDEGEDNSLTAQINNKTLIVKDADTIMQSDTKGKTLSQARDLYDRVSRTHFGNNMGRDYENINMTFILCGTASLRSLDDSELGERFVDCIVMDGINEELEDDIATRVAYREASTNLLAGVKKSESDNADTKISQAMAMTGGYVNYLRENQVSVMNQVRITEDVIEHVKCLGKFVAYMRARPSRYQDEKAERELAARLVSQHMRLVKFKTAVLNKSRADDLVLQRATQVAKDTARGKTLDIARSVYKEGAHGCSIAGLAMETNMGDGETRKYLKFLKAIGVVEPFVKQLVSGIKSKPRYRLTARFSTIYSSVMGKSNG